jgi:hypothetical protein
MVLFNSPPAPMAVFSDPKGTPSGEVRDPPALLESVPAPTAVLKLSVLVLRSENKSTAVL